MSNVINSIAIQKLTKLKVQVTETFNSKQVQPVEVEICRVDRALGSGMPFCTVHFNSETLAPVTLRPSEVARLLNHQPISKQTERADETGRFLIETIIKPLP